MLIDTTQLKQKSKGKNRKKKLELEFYGYLFSCWIKERDYTFEKTGVNRGKQIDLTTIAAATKKLSETPID